MKIPILLFALFLVTETLFGQTPGKIEVTKDAQIDSLIAKRIALGGAARSSGAGSFRVQIYSGSERREAFNAQNRFKASNPSIPTYLSYVEPDYRVQAGDFRTRLDAQKFLSSLKGFPSMIIVPVQPNSSQ